MKLTDKGLQGIREHISSVLDHAEYRSGNTWTRMPIEDVRIRTDGRVSIYLFFDEDAPNKITGIRFYNKAGEIWADGNVSIDKSVYPEGQRYCYSLQIIQTESK